jgi:hypothetical protein
MEMALKLNDQDMLKGGGYDLARSYLGITCNTRHTIAVASEYKEDEIN